MSRPTLYLIAAAACALLASSCAPHSNCQFGVAPPSDKVLVHATTKPKDRHGMPVYRFEERKRLVRCTAYTCTEWDHIEYGNKSAAGTTLLYSRRLRSAAADWSFYPLGTKFRIKGMPHTYIVDDYGSALTGTATVDLYKPSHEVMNAWGLRKVELTVIEWGSMRRSAELLSKRTRYAHCRQMLNNILQIQPALRQVVQVDEEPTLAETMLAQYRSNKSTW